MKSAMVRIDDESRNILREIALQEQEPMQQIVRKAIEHYRRELFLQQCNKAYAALKSDRGAWEKELAEREAWDSAVSDGLDEEKA